MHTDFTLNTGTTAWMKVSQFPSLQLLSKTILTMKILLDINYFQGIAIEREV